MTTTNLANAPLPAGAHCIGGWEDIDPQPYRIIDAARRRVTDHNLTVCPSAVQWGDGSVDDGRIEEPHIYAYDFDEVNPLNPDHARELASALIEVADELDR